MECGGWVGEREERGEHRNHNFFTSSSAQLVFILFFVSHDLTTHDLCCLLLFSPPYILKSYNSLNGLARTNHHRFLHYPQGTWTLQLLLRRIMMPSFVFVFCFVFKLDHNVAKRNHQHLWPSFCSHFCGCLL